MASNVEAGPEPTVVHEETPSEDGVLDWDSPPPSPQRRSSKALEESDTCRICRGEGTTDEPLFHPCKCSGSIKFVHQECLMEWLGHSHKKHCELCKTPFRFTKLYHPHMPQSLPTLVFLRRAAIHIINALLSWCRGILVMSVWFVWLPWSMRFVWSGLFWLGDAGWLHELSSVRQKQNRESLDALRASQANGNSSHSISLSISFPLVQEFLGLFGMKSNSTTSSTIPNPALSNSTLPSDTISHRGSLLSGWTLFHDLTPNPNFNRFALDTMEGQVITLAVVTGFILVFLIREWVVQQQPALNMAAFQNEDNNNDIAHDPADREEAPGDPAPTDMPEANNDEVAGQGSVTASSLRLDGDDESLLADIDVEPHLIVALIDELKASTTALQYLARESFAEWQDDPEDLARAQKAVYDTRKFYLKLRSQSKKALDASRTEESRWALDRLSQLQEALTYLPWADERELADIVNSLQGYMNTAYELITVQEEIAREQLPTVPSSSQDLNQNLTPPMTQALQTLSHAPDSLTMQEPASEPLFDDSQLDAMFAPISETNVGAQSPTDQRPSMPERSQSSIATQIRRQLEENGVSDQGQQIRDPSEAPNGSPLRGTEGWSFVDVPKHEETEASSADLNAGSASSPPSSSHDLEATSSMLAASTAVDLATQRPEPSQMAQSPTHPEHPSLIAHSQSQQSDGMPQVGSLSSQEAQALHDIDTPTPPLEISSGEHSSDRIVAAQASSAESNIEPESSESERHDTDHVHDSETGNNIQDEDRNRIEPDVLPDHDVAATREIQDAERTRFDRILDWIFGDVVPPVPGAETNQQGDPEHIVEDVAAEAPFVPFHDNRPDLHAAPQVPQEPQDAPNDDLAAVQAANVAQDAEAVEDAEDLEGILELIGMQGPLAGLFQNAVFAAVLVSATIATAILFPYICGKGLFILMANPVGAINFPLQLITSAANFTIDSGAFILGTTLAWLDSLVYLITMPFKTLVPNLETFVKFVSIRKPCRKIADAALLRIAETIFATAPRPEQVVFTVDALAALRTLQALARERYTIFEDSLATVYQFTANLHAASMTELLNFLVGGTNMATSYAVNEVKQITTYVMAVPALLRSGRLVFKVSARASTVINDLQPDTWKMSDRVITVLSGYVTFAMAGALYVKRGAPFSSSEPGKRIENIVREMFLQSAGVLKVILIIGIEMLIFPLYCGFLLDTAMLPLFTESSIASRISFTRASVYTSIFFHWFIGTCYMFHFALYVAMCRRIFRNGVLYFIRDPDDPNFHPVRDVLERPVSSQLRKIGFSALVYGGLVILCMGSVVWAVAYGISGIFPIRLTAKDSYFGYPVDLLMYNLLAPLALHFLRPSKGLQTVYDWWFRRSARLLRLSQFLFNDPRADEGGVDAVPDGETRFGSFVRAPTSDHVRLPRGRRVFVEVDEDNNRLDGQPEPTGAEEVHSPDNDRFAKVWIPPWFKLRIGFFVFLMWMLTALLGLSTTVLPLVLGRALIASVTDFQTNDLYSYFVGVCPCLAAYYMKPAIMRGWAYLRDTVHLDSASFASASKAVANTLLQGLRIIYIYGVFALVVPSLIACLLECYFILPLQTYTSLPERPAAPHTVYLLQDWTMGLLYLRIAMRVVLWNSDTRLARGLRAVVARGWFDPDARVATRCFILPLVVLAVTAILLPSSVAYLVGRALPLIESHSALRTKLTSLGPDDVAALQTDMIRFSYPLVLAVALTLWSMWVIKHAARRWRMRIRDEIYLIGERLHNFGEGRPTSIPAS